MTPDTYPPDTLLVFDASAYRVLAREAGDAAAVRDAARALADAAHAAGRHPVVSPFTLWTLLADVAAAVASAGGGRGGRSGRGPTEAEHARAARARLAIAACATHGARTGREPGPHPFVLAEDPESLLFHAIGLQPPPGLAVFNEYLASVAAELAAEPTVERAQRLAGPLAHVAERGDTAAEDFADEMQDAVLATYDAASTGFGWDDDTTDEERQRALAGPIIPIGVDDPIGEPFIVGLLRRDPLLRAVAARRAARARLIAARAAGESPDEAPEPTADEVARVAEGFPSGIALGRELLRRVIAGDVETAGRAARRWLWDLHIAFGLGAAYGVAGGEIIASAATDVMGIESLAAHRQRLRA